jgi:hypothetical protein
MARIGNTLSCTWSAGSRSGEFNPVSIPNCILDLDARYVTLSGGNVTTWLNNVPGQVHNFTDGGVSTRRPLWVDNGWATGLPCVRFDGTTDSLLCTTGLANSMVGGTDNNCCMIAVARGIATTGFSQVIWCFSRSAVDADPLFYGQYGTSHTETLRDDAAAIVNVTGTQPFGFGTKRTYGVNKHGTTTSVKLNGIYDPSAGSQNVGLLTIDQAVVGSRRFLATNDLFANIDIVRICGWTRDLTVSEFDDAVSALSTFYGTP